ncbi:MAG: DUF433 domain-containing protein [Candidatus Zixiibacteriota bacterium]|nr:MAG: DUF433 domain-containing protein [candidate division Zixibacteria bacterium]
MEQSVHIRDTEIEVTELLLMIGEGHSYEQILAAHPGLNMGDIMAAARFAADIINSCVTAPGIIRVDHSVEFRLMGNRMVNVTEIRKEFPKAFAPWTANEDNQLVGLFKKGEKLERIAEIHQRKPGAIRARLEKLGLIERTARSD